ncbi:kinase-like domain-containing protein [Suillus clintonianus]|uniref:kinase-like domain-containing protein n=1 Tax=Suillus clintonianus TaxID=1904413 RepID=UPI001B871C1C|nr:kinase-like domain-containing protein [Suillus clintonianus]KAG2134516.1 kinase-like domain-containing protein [Suillus clintonianus]
MASHQVDFKTPLKEIPLAELEKTQDSAYYTGGFGDVWKCTWSTSSKEPPLTVAIKVVRVPDISQTELLAKTARDIRREAYVWANLKDGHVLSLHGITSGFGVLPAFISSWMTKGSLDSYLKQKPTLLIFRKLDMSHQIASGLKYLHEEGIVHGDLTPTNILIDSDDKLCLADFGLSVILAESGNPTFNSCHAGNVRWMAPEMFVVPEHGELTKPTKPADVYSYGCIMLQEPYFELVHVYHVMAAILKGTKPFHQLTGVDEGHEQYALRCLSANFGGRPSVQDIVAFIKAELKKLLLSSGETQDSEDGPSGM